MTQQRLATPRDARPQASATPDALHVLLEGDDGAVEAAASAAGLDVVAWIRRTLTDGLEARDARVTRDAKTETVFRSLVEATQYSFPTADIEDMLRETEAGRWVRR